MTIRQISKKTGLSTATICKAFKDPLSVKSSTWEKIQNIKNPTPPNIKNIHVLLPDLHNSFFSELLAGILEGLDKYGISPIVHLSHDNAKREKDILASIPSSKHTAIIWVPGSHSDHSVIPKDTQFRIALVDRDLSHGAVKIKVLLDNTHLAKVATEFLISQGSCAPCFINGPQKSCTSQERQKGFTIATSQKLYIDSPDVYFGEFNNTAFDFQLCCELLSKKKHDAYLLGNQTIAYSFLYACNTLKIDVPLCIAFDKIPQVDLYHHPISTIILPDYQMGFKVASLLLSPPSDSIVNDQLIYYAFEGKIQISNNIQGYSN